VYRGYDEHTGALAEFNLAVSISAIMPMIYRTCDRYGATLGGFIVALHAFAAGLRTAAPPLLSASLAVQQLIETPDAQPLY